MADDENLTNPYSKLEKGKDAPADEANKNQEISNVQAKERLDKIEEYIRSNLEKIKSMSTTAHDKIGLTESVGKLVAEAQLLSPARAATFSALVTANIGSEESAKKKAAQQMDKMLRDTLSSGAVINQTQQSKKSVDPVTDKVLKPETHDNIISDITSIINTSINDENYLTIAKDFIKQHKEKAVNIGSHAGDTTSKAEADSFISNIVQDTEEEERKRKQREAAPIDVVAFGEKEIAAAKTPEEKKEKEKAAKDRVALQKEVSEDKKQFRLANDKNKDDTLDGYSIENMYASAISTKQLSDSKQDDLAPEAKALNPEESLSGDKPEKGVVAGKVEDMEKEVEGPVKTQEGLVNYKNSRGVLAGFLSADKKDKDTLSIASQSLKTSGVELDSSKNNHIQSIQSPGIDKGPQR